MTPVGGMHSLPERERSGEQRAGKRTSVSHEFDAVNGCERFHRIGRIATQRKNSTDTESQAQIFCSAVGSLVGVDATAGAFPRVESVRAAAVGPQEEMKRLFFSRRASNIRCPLAYLPRHSV